MTRLPQSAGIRGHALVDAMLALLMLAAGALGCAAMQLQGLRAARQAQAHADAAALAGELAELAALAGDDLPAFDTAAPAPAAPGCYGRLAACGPGQWAGFELARWRGQLRAALPLAQARLERDGVHALLVIGVPGDPPLLRLQVRPGSAR